MLREGFDKYKNLWKGGIRAGGVEGGKAWGSLSEGFPQYSRPFKIVVAIFRPWRWGRRAASSWKAGDGLLGIGADPPVDELLGGFLLDLQRARG